MKGYLRFGIPSLDVLFGARKEGAESVEAVGIWAQSSVGVAGTPASGAVSICISGPDGTGKSVLGLHLASRYSADCYADYPECLPKVLYVSTDLKYEMAARVWRNFGLDQPNNRTVPFALREEIGKREPQGLKAKLLPCLPLGEAQEGGKRPLADYLSKAPERKGPEAEIYL